VELRPVVLVAGWVVEEEPLASRALHTHAPAHSLHALTHAAASWPAAPLAPAHAVGLICDGLFMRRLSTKG